MESKSLNVNRDMVSKIVPVFPQEIINEIIWQVGRDHREIKVLSTISKCCVQASQTILYKRIQEWATSLDGLLTMLEAGCSLVEVALASVAFCPNLWRTLDNVWFCFPHIVLEQCSMKEEHMQDILTSATKLTTLCIGLGDHSINHQELVASEDGDDLEPINSLLDVSDCQLQSFFYIMEIGCMSFLHSDVYCNQLSLLLNTLQFLFVRANYCVMDSVQVLIDRNAHTLTSLNIFFVCCFQDTSRTLLNIAKCHALSSVVLGEDIRHLDVLTGALQMVPNNNDIQLITIHLSAPLDYFDALQWAHLWEVVEDRNLLSRLVSVNLEFYVFRQVSCPLWDGIVDQISTSWMGTYL
ncbi:hypothetical protein ARMGADRAFT_1029549 [Armillaria gallica]|uniref:F-box domain-containing protein n=1 Tax=Armillaria gallica TaxID=47427 RepID=A0A2H3DZE5_ARMGA|nr:hypothetical protein ARMGADRAFT_1029549 [Armillaria gallica]